MKYCVAAVAFGALCLTGVAEPVRISERFGFDLVDSTRFIQAALDAKLPGIVLDRQATPWVTCDRCNQPMVDIVMRNCRIGNNNGKAAEVRVGK